MELSALRMSISESDANELIRRFMPKGHSVEDLRVQFSPEGVHVHGVFPIFIDVHFETVWEVTLRNHLVVARLLRFKAMGVPGAIFKSAVMKAIEDEARHESWLQVVGDEILADCEVGLAKHLVPMKLRLSSLRLEGNALHMQV